RAAAAHSRADGVRAIDAGDSLVSAGSRVPVAFSACACSVRINAPARENAPGSARTALWPTPTSAMFCSPLSLHDVRGATIAACQDQIDDTGGIANLRRYSA